MVTARMKNRSIAILRYLSGAALVFLLLFGTVFASADESKITAERIEDGLQISGVLSEDSPYATLLILYPGKSLPEEREGNIDASDLIGGIQFLELDGGKLECMVPIGSNAPFGEYSVFVQSGGVRYETSVRVSRDDPMYYEELRQALNSGADSIETLLEYRDITLLDADWFQTAPAELKQYFEQEIQAMLPIEAAAGIEAFLKQTGETANQVYALDEINGAGTIKEFADAAKKYAARFQLLFDPTGAEAESLVNQLFTELPCFSPKKMEEWNVRYLEDRINAVSWGKYLDLINEYPQIGIADAETLLRGLPASRQEAVFRRLAQKAPFSDLPDFCSKFEAALTEEKKAGSGNSSGSGGKGGGGNSSKGSWGAGVPVLAAPKNDETDTDKSTPGIYFTDLEQVEWARESIAYLASVNAISGIGDNRFQPMDAVRREEFVKMLLNAFSFTVASGRPPFEDTEAGAWYENYIYTAFTEGVVTGISETEFGVGGLISRQDAATLIDRIVQAKQKTYDLTLKGELPADMGAVSDYAADAVRSMFSACILNGDENGQFRPMSSLTRAEAAKMIYSVLKSVK